MLTVAKSLLDNERVREIGEALEFLGIETDILIEHPEPVVYRVRFIDKLGNSYQLWVDGLEDRIIDEGSSRCIENRDELRLHAILHHTFSSPRDKEHGAPQDWTPQTTTGTTYTMPTDTWTIWQPAEPQPLPVGSGDLPLSQDRLNEILRSQGLDPESVVHLGPNPE